MRYVHGVLHVVAVRAHRARRDRHARAHPAPRCGSPRPGLPEGARGARVRRARALPDAGRRRVLDLRAPTPHVSHLRLPGVRRHRRRARRSQPAIAAQVRRWRFDDRRPDRSRRLPPTVTAHRAADRAGAAARSLSSASASRYGIDVTAVFARNSSRPLSTSALWLCSRCSHQCSTKSSGMSTLTIVFGQRLLELVDEARASRR